MRKIGRFVVRFSAVNRSLKCTLREEVHATLFCRSLQPVAALTSLARSANQLLSDSAEDMSTSRGIGPSAQGDKVSVADISDSYGSNPRRRLFPDTGRKRPPRPQTSPRQPMGLRPAPAPTTLGLTPVYLEYPHEMYLWPGGRCILLPLLSPLPRLPLLRLHNMGPASGQARGTST